VNQLFREVLENEFVEVNRLTRIYYKEKFIAYPIQLGDVMKKVGLFDLFFIGCSYLWAKLFPYRNPKNFEERTINAFGKQLYTMFFKTYTEKLRGIPCTEIGALQAAQRIKGVSVSSILKQALFPQKMKGKVKSMIDKFDYPKYGNGFLYEKMQKKLEANGVQFVFGSKLQKIEKMKSGKFLVNGEKFDKVVSSIPIDSFLSLFV
jgi:protoporphyrinogen oxidase